MINRSISFRIIVAFVHIIILILILAGVSIHRLGQLKSRSETVFFSYQSRLSSISTLKSTILFHSLKVEQFIAGGNKINLTEYEKLQIEIERIMYEFINDIYSKEEEERLGTIIKSYNTYLSLSSEIQELSMKNPEDIVRIQGKQIQIFALLENELLYQLEKLYEFKYAIAEEAVLKNRATYQTSIKIIFFSGVILIIYVIIVVSILEHVIIFPLQNLICTAQRFKAGEFDARIEVKYNSKNEIGKLTDTFNDMACQQQELIEQLEKRVDERTQKLSEVNEALQKEIEVGKRHENELKRYMQQLKYSNEELEHFAYVASHDLLEPLHKICFFGERLNEKNKENDDEKAKNYLSRMLKATYRMQALIEGLLSYSKIVNKGDDFESVDLNAVVKEVKSDLEVLIQKYRAQINVCRLPIITANLTQMRQLFQNLLENAIKYSREDAPCEVTIGYRLIEEYANDEERCLHQITISDNGIGFNQDHLRIIFQIFGKLHQAEYGGTGIGLAICKRIVQRHNGTITATSKVGEGTTFIINLPKLDDKE